MDDRRDPVEPELIARYREGDAEALCALFDRHERVLRARIEKWLPAHVRRRVSISDVLQETRIVAHDRCADFEPRGPKSFQRWVLGIAELKARRAVQRHDAVAARAVRREVTQPQRRATAQFLGNGPSPSQLAIASELADLARKAMETLPEDYRAVLRLAREEHMTLREAAEEMGRTHAATKKLYGRALQRFVEALKELRGETLG